MYKLWRNYSYTIILVIFSLAALMIIKVSIPTDIDQYMTITVMDGDSLWTISKRYEDKHKLSNKEFINWVESYNGISGDYIFSGDKLVIPIKKESVKLKETHNLASK